MDRDERLGSIATHLALNFPVWVERRVEHVSYLDRDTTRWTEGLMIRWPPRGTFFPEGVEPDDGEQIYVPLDLLTKRTLVGLEGWRPDGSPFPILPASRSTALASAGITAVVWGHSIATGGAGLKPETIRILDEVVRSPPGPGPELFSRAISEPGSELGGLLSAHSEIRALLEQLALDVMFLAPAVYRSGEESVYRYTYCRSLPRKDRLLIRVAVSMGFLDAATIHKPLSLGRSGSYHFEAEAPPELKISRARLRGLYGPKRVPALVAEAEGAQVVDLYARRPTERSFVDGQAINPRTRPPVLPELPQNATLPEAVNAVAAARPTPVQTSDEGEAEIRFRLEPSGTFLAATVVSVLTAGLLFAALSRLEELDGQAAATLLLALPVLVLGYLTRPGEHSLATRLLLGIRGASLLVGVCALVIAGILGGGFVHHEGAGSPDYACRAGIGEQPTLTHTHDPDGQEPLLTGLRCTPDNPPADVTTVPATTRAIATAVTWLAIVLAGLLFAGLLSTTFRSKRLLPTPELAGVDARQRPLRHMRRFFRRSG